MKLELLHYDTCLPDYFGGHHKSYIQIPVYKNMTMKELKESLHNELNSGYISLGHDSLPDGCIENDHELTDKGYRLIKAAINRLERARKNRKRLFSHLPENNDDYVDSVYAYFLIEEC